MSREGSPWKAPAQYQLRQLDVCGVRESTRAAVAAVRCAEADVRTADAANVAYRDSHDTMYVPALPRLSARCKSLCRDGTPEAVRLAVRIFSGDSRRRSIHQQH